MIYVRRRRARNQPSFEVCRYIGINPIITLLGMVGHVVGFKCDRVGYRDGTVRDHGYQSILGPGLGPQAVRELVDREEQRVVRRRSDHVGRGEVVGPPPVLDIRRDPDLEGHSQHNEVFREGFITEQFLDLRVDLEDGSSSYRVRLLLRAIHKVPGPLQRLSSRALAHRLAGSASAVFSEVWLCPVTLYVYGGALALYGARRGRARVVPKRCSCCCKLSSWRCAGRLTRRDLCRGRVQLVR